MNKKINIGAYSLKVDGKIYYFPFKYIKKYEDKSIELTTRSSIEKILNEKSLTIETFIGPKFMNEEHLKNNNCYILRIIAESISKSISSLDKQCFSLVPDQKRGNDEKMPTTININKIYEIFPLKIIYCQTDNKCQIPSLSFLKAKIPDNAQLFDSLKEGDYVFVDQNEFGYVYLLADNNNLLLVNM